MASNRPRWRKAALLGIVVGLVLLGVSGSNGQSNSDIVVGITPVTANIDPRAAFTLTDWSIVRHYAEPLVFNNAQGKLEGLLAQSWQRVDPLTYRFQLRRGVKFQNGEPLTAAAIKFTLESVMDPKSKFFGQRSVLRLLDRVETPDDYTVILRMKTPSRSLLTNLVVVPIVSPKAVQEEGEGFALQPVATGPYRVIEFRPNERLVLERFDGYWGRPGVPRRITYRYLVDDATRVAALRAGEVQAINNLPPDSVSTVKADPRLQILSTPTQRIAGVAMRADRSQFKDVRVRRAMNLAVDRDAIVQKILGGFGEVATRPLHRLIPTSTGDVERYAYDPQKARQLLSEAGYPGGFAVTFGAPRGKWLKDESIAQAVVGYLEAVGVKIKAEFNEWAIYDDKTWDKGYDMFYFALGAPTMDPAWEMFWQTENEHYGLYYNARVQELLRKGEAANNIEEARPFYVEAQKLFWKDAPWIFLHFSPELIGAAKNLRGFAPRADEFELFLNADLQ